MECFFRIQLTTLRSKLFLQNTPSQMLEGFLSTPGFQQHLVMFCVIITNNDGMGFFEFLNGSKIICLHLNISEKLHCNIFSKRQMRQRLIAFIFVKTIQYSHTLKNNIYHSGKQLPPSFFHLHTNPVIGPAPVHPVDKTHVLVITAELIWLFFLNKISFNFVPTLRKSLRFTRFRRSYVNHPSVVLTNCCQSFTDFLLGVLYSQ